MRKKKIINFIVLIIAIIIVVIELFPIVITVLNGFKRDIDIWTGNPFQFKFSLKSYETVFKKREFITGMKNSLIVAFLSTSISIVVGSMAAYGIARFRFKLRNTLAYSFLVFRMLPQISLVIALYMMFRYLGMIDTIAAITLAHTSFNIPYVIWLLIPFFASIPKDYEEAALVDGANSWQIFWVIFFPLVAPGIVVAAVFAFIMSWNEFLYALILTGIRSKTAPVAVNAFMGQYAPLWGQISAAGTIMLLPVFVFTITMQRFIIRGIGAGGVKG